MRNKYSVFSLIKNALSYHENWQRAWKDPAPKKEYDAVIVGGGGHGLATAYYLAKEHNFKNIAVVEPGYKSSNITFPADNPQEEFIQARLSNRGNGDRFYSIVNEYDLKSYYLLFHL